MIIQAKKAFYLLMVLICAHSLHGDATTNKHKQSRQQTVLIVGATGLVGSAAAEQFIEEDWNVITVSRRTPLLQTTKPFRHITVDLLNKNQCDTIFAGLHEITHVVYAALAEKPHALIEGWFDPQQMELNKTMLGNVLEPLLAHAHVQHVTLLQGTKAYGLHFHPITIPAHEDAPRDNHPNFYWLQEDYLREKSSDYGFSFTIARPPLILGTAHGAAMNILLAIGVYAALCHELGLQCGFPGGPSNVFQCVDVRLLAKFCTWAAHAELAQNQTFNLTNGDVAEWRTLWPSITKALGVALGPDAPCSLKTFFAQHEKTWDKVVAKYNLVPLPLNTLIGESHEFADVIMAAGETAMRPPTFISDIAVRQAGFIHYSHTHKAIPELLQELIKQNILPKLS